MSKINHYRITKFNPAYRDKAGQFSQPDWTSISDNVSMEEYLKIENQYAKSVLDCIILCGSKKIKVISTEENHSIFKLGAENEISYKDWGSIDALVRLALRGKTWFKIIGSKSFYVHFGYDYYMYIGGQFEIKTNKINNLFVEKFKSPYFTN